MNDLQIDHIGYLVKKLDAAEEQFQRLGFRCVSEVTHDTIREVDIIFMEKDGYRIELVSPYDKSSVVSSLIKTYRNAPYHICYSSKTFDEALSELCGNGFTLTDEPREAPAFGGKRVAFLVSAKTGLMELLETE